MKTLLLACLAGTASIMPVTVTSAADTAQGDTPTAPVQQVGYDNSVMNDDRVVAGSATANGGTSTYQGYWNGAYREDGTYHGEWRGTYRGRDGKLYDGQYAGTFIGEGNPYPAPAPKLPQTGAIHAVAAPAVAAEPAPLPAPLPALATTMPVQAGANYEAPQYVQAPAQPAAAETVVSQQTPPQYRYPSGWNGYYYPQNFPPATTTIVIHTAPGKTTTTTYYEE